MTKPSAPASAPPIKAVQPDSAPLLVQRLQDARQSLRAGQPALAERLLDEALELAPDNAEARRLMGIAASITRKFPKAIIHLRATLAHNPDDVAIQMALGAALVETDAVADGLEHLERACTLAPESTEAWYNLGVVFKFNGDLGQARAALDRAVTIDPGHIKARNKLADVLVGLGDVVAAVGLLRGTLGRQPDCVDAWVILGNLKTEKFSSDDVGQLRGLLGRLGVSDDARIPIGFTLARALEDQADYAAAFDAVCEANALKRRQVHWDRREERARVLAVEHAFAGPLPTPPDPAFGKEAIFVVCLPRSASTLVEQILASHPSVTGGGELQALEGVLDEESRRLGQAFPEWVGSASAADWHRLGEDYLERARHKCGQGPHFTDKSINNWSLAGAALAMLPGAHVVNSRRDPLETCFACFRQLFPEGCHCTYDLDDMVDYYAGYDRLSALWRRQFPDRYFDNDYELLQSSTELQVRRLLAFCGLPWDPACLAFHKTRRIIDTFSSAQVREPMQRDTARAPLYGAKLDPLRAKLRATGISVTDG